MLRNWMCVISLLIRTTVASPAWCDSGSRLVAYAPVEVRLEGVVRIDEHFGPPNFGEDPEHDSVLQVPILLLETPIDIMGDTSDDLNRDSFSGVTHVQIIAGDLGLSLLSCGGTRVIAIGTLEVGLLPSQFTRVVLKPRAITQSDGAPLKCQ